MNQERLMKVLLSPHMSEKANMLAEQHQQFVFRVASDATKPEIRKAVELMFDVKVKGVSVLNVKGKTKRFGGRMGHRSDWKKAYVTLAAGEEIDLLGGE